MAKDQSLQRYWQTFMIGASTIHQIKLTLVCLQRLLNCLVLTSKYTLYCYLRVVCLMTSTTDR